jgi:hypothetical protein
MLNNDNIDELELDEIVTNLPNDTILLEAYLHEGMLRLVLGITDFSLICQPVRQRIQLGLFNFRRVCTDIIPSEYSGKICTAQLYQICE